MHIYLLALLLGQRAAGHAEQGFSPTPAMLDPLILHLFVNPFRVPATALALENSETRK